MSFYLSERQLQHAVEQLKKSTAKSRMCEFLIGVRTLKLAGTSQVAVAESVPQFVQALNEFTRWTDATDETNPFFNPFGSAASYKFKRFKSNGPSNTMHGWATQADAPFSIHTTRPKSIERRAVTISQLRSFLLTANGVAGRPRLIDAAVWFYRSTELAATNPPDRTALEDRFVTDVGLTVDEVTALFRRESDDSDDDVLAPASPDASVESTADHSTDAVAQPADSPTGEGNFDA